MIAILIGGIAKGQWQQCNSPELHVKRLAVKDTNLFVATYDSGIYISQNYGATWSPRNNGLIYNGVSDFAINDTYFLAAQNHGILNSYIYSSNDNGLTWISNPSNYNYFLRVSGSHVMKIGFVGENIGYKVSVSNLNFYVDFDIFNSGDNPRFVALYNNNLYLAYSGANSFGIEKYNKSDSTWRYSFLTPDLKDLIVVDSNLYSITSVGIFKQSENDTNWILLLSDTTLTGPIIKYGNRLIAGTKNGVYYCNYDGTAWCALNNGLQNKEINSIVINGMYLFASTFDNGIWKLPLSEIVGINENQTNQNLYLFPNPATNSLTLNLSQLKNLQNTTVSIYDIQGKLLLQQKIMLQQTELNISQFAKGICIVKVNNDKETMQSKFVKE